MTVCVDNPRLSERLMIVLLLPAADGVADFCAERLPQATVLRYEDADRSRLDEVTFYCLPYMGNAGQHRADQATARGQGDPEHEQRGR